MKNAITNLAREHDDPFITTGFVAAENFHRNFFHDHMERYEMAAERPAVQQFIARLLALLDEAGGDAAMY